MDSLDLLELIREQETEKKQQKKEGGKSVNKGLNSIASACMGENGVI